MKQSEKVDLIIQKLYEQRYNYRNLYDLMKEVNIYENDDEVWALGKRIKETGYAEVHQYIGGGIDIRISPKGVDYHEITSNESTSAGGSSNVYYVTGHGNSFVSDSNNVTVNQQTQVGNTASRIIDTIKEALPQETGLSLEQKQEIVERLEEIEEKLASKKQVRKHNITDLLSIAANSAQITSFLMQLGQVLHLIPGL